MEVLYSDAQIAVCLKPVGLDSETQVSQALEQRLAGPFFIVHRLDQNVGGLMVCARTSQAAAQLSRAIQEGQFVKEYVAMVHGTPPPQGDWEDLLFKDNRKNKVFVVKRPRAGVKAARLEYTLLRQGPESLVRIRLHTGRSHQIRVQFSSRGFPLVGDHKYGSRSPRTAPMLYSCRLSFPLGGKTMEFQHLPDWAQ